MNIIKQLSSFDVKDLKNIDIKQARELLQSRPDIFINILLIGLTLFATIQIYSWHANQLNKTNDEITLSKEKLDVVAQQKKIRGEYDQFVNIFPPSIPTDQLINKLSELALKNKVQILSFSPAEAKGNNYFELTTVKFNISAEDYNDMLSFIQDIENSTYSIRVGKWSGKSDYDYSQQNDIEIKKPFDVTIEIESIKLKKND